MTRGQHANGQAASKKSRTKRRTIFLSDRLVKESGFPPIIGQPIRGSVDPIAVNAKCAPEPGYLASTGIWREAQVPPV
ncbi:hypothetical protein R52603_03166 [Paraburkholderia saeva]|uniref:Uncharacterized protein n=1 Tax=Paraburkholderia saeva TaxID=2777537 RepID=A0A9N8S0S5_9BURK|nr:hypothetical protein R52603_03166 [Paraburkholderia saeva]CAG4915056.1 hypothetical protein LMG31841_04438 [Paraburkholderia saeva]